MNYLIYLTGVIFFLGVGWLLSNNRRAINWGTIAWGMGLQILFAVLVLKTSAGQQVFVWLNDVIIKLLSYQYEGGKMIFGALAIPHGEPGHMGFFFAFQILPTIIFFSALTALLYYLGILQKIVYGFAWVMKKTLKISGAESLSASANIFIGQTEAPLLVKPYVKDMTQSELMCVMTGGMATVAGGVLAAYIGLLKGYFPNIAGHLLAASIMAAPAGVVMAKLIIPETQVPKTAGSLKMKYKDPNHNVLEAVATGTTMGLTLALNVGAMLIAFMALIALANGLVGWLFSLGGIQGMSLSVIFGYAFAPIAWLLGVPSNEIVEAGRLLGEKTVLNEFVAYLNFAEIMKNPGAMSVKTGLILSYALCGFANFLSIGIQIAGIGGIAPSRRKDIAALGLRAMIAGFMANNLRTAIAALLIFM